jgi:glycosyltransferase involved in cell wall biosynthesis
MTHVLHVVTLLSADGRYGGPQTVARTLATRFGDEIWGGATSADFRAEPASPPGERRFRAVEPPGERYSLLVAPGLWAALWRRLRPATRPDVVHLHVGPEVAGLAALLVLVARRARFVVQPHGMFTYPPDSARGRTVRRVFIPLIRRAQAVIALTDAERDLLIGYGLEPGRVEVISNGIDHGGFRPAPRSGDEPVVAFVGRLHPRKHPERFTGAAALLAARATAARFVTAGADQGALDAARAADPDGVVEHLGALAPDDARQVIADARVVVVCSDVEPFGMVAIEALAYESALLITDSCDLAPELESAGAALVTAPTPEAIAEGVARLLADPDLRAAQAGAGVAVVQQRYSMDVVAPRWVSLYRRASTAGSPVPDLDGAS